MPAALLRGLTPVEAVINQKQAATTRQLRPGKAYVQRFPMAAEREYTKELLQYVRGLEQATTQFVIPQLPAILHEANALKPKFDAVVLDDYADMLMQAVRASRLYFGLKYSDDQLRQMVLGDAHRIDDFNKIQFGRVMKSIIGVDVFASEPFLTPAISSFVTANVSLIKTIESRHWSRIEQTVLGAARQGIRHEEVAQQIQSDYNVSENIAIRIARDQTNKFNGQLTQLRQTNIGVKKYIWRTVGDDRVRDEHEELDDHEFSWDDAPPDGHPGEAINCRCYAEPVLDMFFTNED